MTDIFFCASKIFSLVCLLKPNFWYRCKSHVSERHWVLLKLHLKRHAKPCEKRLTYPKQKNSECLYKERQLIIKVSSTIDKSWLKHESD